MEIRKFQHGDEHSILSLFEICFAKKMRLDYWTWRFLNNPATVDPMIYLMWEKGKLVGHYAVSPQPIIFDNRECLGGLSMTTMTHPDFGQRGIFTMLAKDLYQKERQLNGLEWVFGFPNNKSHRGFIKNLNWSNVTVIPTFSLRSSKFALSKDTEPVEMKKTTVFTESNVQAYNQITNHFQFKIKKDLRYLNWRYINNPINKYQILSFEDGQFIVFKEHLNKTNDFELDIVEWTIDVNLENSRKALSSIFALFEANEVSKINLWMPLFDPRYILLEKIGFEHAEPLTYFGYSNLEVGKKKISNDNYFVQLGDSDVY